jgi:Protein of unknown function (DUF4238)
VSEPRKHHYVPVFYQQHFVNVHGALWLYDRRLKTYKELHPQSICFEKDLYALKPKGAPRKRDIETKILPLIEGMGATAIRELRIGETPPFETVQAIAYFAAIQFGRVPSMGRTISSIYERAANEAMRVMAASVDRMKRLLEDYSHKTGARVDVSAEAMVEAVQNNKIAAVATEAPFLQNIFYQAEYLSKLIEHLDWQILVAPDETGFVICDCPVVVVPRPGSNDVGFVVPGGVKYFPLTRRLCLRLGDFGNSFRYRKASKETIRTVNYNIAANSERFIMGPDLAQVRSVVANSESADEDARPRFSVETIEQSADGSLQKMTFQPRRYFYTRGSAP